MLGASSGAARVCLRARSACRAIALLSLLQPAAAQSPEQLRKVEAAVAQQRRAISLRPTDGTAYFELASAYRDNRFLRAASVEMGHAVALRPDEPEWHRQLGILLARVGDPQGALRHYHSSLALRPTSAETYFNLGNALGTHDLAAKTAAFERTIELSPTFVSAYMNLANIHETRQRGSGVGVLRRLMEFDVQAGRRRLTDTLEGLDRNLEAAVAHVDAIRMQRAAAAREGPGAADPSLASAAHREWHDFVTTALDGAIAQPPKCIDAIGCVAGLERALAVAAERPSCAEAHEQLLTSTWVQSLLTAATPTPTKLRRAVA
eukprot:1885651-Prymnesium_polylepis.1